VCPQAGPRRSHLKPVPDEITTPLLLSEAHLQHAHGWRITACA